MSEAQAGSGLGAAPAGAAPPFFRAVCPACGAPVELRSATSAFAVCGYCHSSLVPRGDALERIGKASAVFEDYSPLQLGSAGRHEGRGFQVIGHLQMGYAGGAWNEWHLLHDDGSTGWLSDAGGQYALLQPLPWPPEAPAYAQLKPGAFFLAEGLRYTVSDRREARAIGARGELPFAPGERWTAPLVDARSAERFITLDWSDPAAPAAYRGRTVTLGELALQFLRSEAEVAETAGRVRGQLASLACVQCGAALPVVTGVTLLANCPSCGSELDTRGGASVLIRQGREAEARTRASSLSVGDAGVLEGQRWMVLGIVRQHSRVEGSTHAWTDYLLYRAGGGGFLWLSESKGEWLRSEAVSRWPVRLGGDRIREGETTLGLDDRYESVVTAAWGSFPWEVKVGDRAQCEEFVPQGRSALPPGTRWVCETTPDEQGWSRCTPLDRRAVLAAFGRATAARSPLKPERAGAGSGGSVRAWAGFAMIGHLMLWAFEPTGTGFTIGLITLILFGVWGWMIEGDT